MENNLTIFGRFCLLPINRYFQRKEVECEPSKVTLQISSKGIKLVADSLRHFVPSHAVTYVSQGAPPDDDIVSVILLLYNPITKCPVHLHAYRCDSVETADLLSEQLQLLVDLPENQRKIRDLEQRLQSQGLYPSAGQSQSRMLIKSCDTGLGGSSGDLLAGHSDSSSDDVASNDVGKSTTMDLQRPVPLQSDTAISKTDQERIARLYDSLAAELRDKLGGAMSGKAAPLLLPPKDYEEQPESSRPSANKNAASNNQRAGRSAVRGNKQTDNGSSSGLSSGIGSDLDDPVAERSRNREWMRSVSCQQPDSRHQLQQARQRYSYHDSSGSNNNILLHQHQHQQQQQQHQEVVQRRRDPVMRQMSERRDTSTLLNRRSMSDLRRQEESAVMIRRREESCRDVRGSNAELSRSRAEFQQHPLLADGNNQRSRVKEALSKFEGRDHQHEPVVKAVNASSRSRSFRDDQPSQGWNAGVKYRRQQSTIADAYQELDQRERFPGLDRETARQGVLEPHHREQMAMQHHHHQRHLQRHKSSEFVSMIKRGPNESGSVVVVEPTQKVGNRHFRAVRQPN